MFLSGNNNSRLGVLILSLSLSLTLGFPALAQNLDSTTYTIIAPSIGEPINGISDSTTYSQLQDSSPIDDFITTSTTYRADGGNANAFEANVPTILCAEAATDSGSTTCTGVPGGNGMYAVCTYLGCYDRAKIEINAQGNPADARYAIQVSTSSDFSSNVYYLDATTRLLKASLTVADFIPKCEWEGTTSSGVCGSPNTTWQKYNMIGISPDLSTLYVRASAHRGLTTDGKFQQSEWGPSAQLDLSIPVYEADIDIAPTTAGSSNPPFLLNLGSSSAGVIKTSSDQIIFRLSTNAISGVQTLIKGLNGGLTRVGGSETITSANADLSSVGSGFGLRNISASNSAVSTTYLGDITISSTPNDFTDAGATHKVGAVGTTFVKLFDSNSLPLDTGVAGFVAKFKPATSHPAGNYRETMTYLIVGTF